MRHRRIIEHPQNVGDSVHVAQRRQGITIFFFLHAAEIDVLHRGIGNFLGIVERGQFFQARLGHFGNAYVSGLTALAFDIRLGQDAEERGLPYLRQSNNSSLHKPKSLAHHQPMLRLPLKAAQW